jgi:DNA polymerase III delta subunit
VPAKSSTAAPVPPMAILHGPERFLLLDHTDQLRTRVAAAHGEPTTTLFDGTSASPADILDECRSMNLMMTHKLVIVDNADTLLKAADDDADTAPSTPARRGHGSKSARELFEAYAESPEPSATLILRAAAWRPGKLDKAVTASGGIVLKCEPLSEPEAVGWAVDRAKQQHRATLNPDAAQRLIDATGPDLGRIDMELAKLALFEPGQPITAQAVALLSETTREEEFWEIQPTLLSGDPARALAHLRDLLDVSRHDPTPLLFTFFDLARKLHGASRGLANREPPRSIMGRLRLWGPSADAILAAAARLKPTAAAALMHAVVDATTRTRTGRADAEHALEALTLQFASTVRG